MTDLKGNREGRLVCLISLILASGTLACYWPARHFDFVNLDDPLYVYDTPIVQQGLTWPGFIWAFKSIQGGNWNPLVWLSHMADCQFYGLKAGGHHVTNILLHTANVLLLFLAFTSMTGAVWRSAFVAAIFAWHPMHVESVAWVAERKDVLSTLFLLSAIWAYAAFSKADGRRRKRLYVLALFFFVLGLMCKSMLVTLPMILLLLDYWPLQRMETRNLSGLVIEKLPFLALSAAACVLAVWTQHTAGAMANAAPLPLRLENAAVSYATYVVKLFWPVNLAIFYPFPHWISIWRVAGAVLLLVAISWAVIWGMKKRPYLGVGWFWFLGTLVPVIGFVQVGLQALADRYTYIPHIGLAVMISWSMADLAEPWRQGRAPLIGVAAVALACCLAVSSSQVEYWRDNTAIYEHAIKVTSGNYIAHSNLGYVLMDAGKPGEAAEHFEEVVRLKPDIAKAYNSLGMAYALQGKLDEAMLMFLKAIALNRELPESHYNLGNAYFKKGRMAEAMTELKTALRLKPDDIPTQKTLAEMLTKTGKFAEAIPYCKAVVAADPKDAHAHFTLGWAYQAEKQPEQAVACYKEAVRLSPDTAQCLNALAWIYATSPKAGIRNAAAAVSLATRACEITKQQDTQLLDTLAAAHAEAGRFDEAIKTTEKILTLAASAHDTNTADTARQRLDLYKAGKPLRDEP